MKNAKLMPIAGIMDGKSLYAVMDSLGFTEYQIWETPERMAKLHKLI